jgi:hypothetical protein
MFPHAQRISQIFQPQTQVRQISVAEIIQNAALQIHLCPTISFSEQEKEIRRPSIVNVESER